MSEVSNLERLAKDKELLERIIGIFQRNFVSEQEMLDFALEESIQLTESQIGYIYHYNEANQEFVLNTWSRNVMPLCSVTNPQSCYELKNTGIWGEAVRQHRPIIINDFTAHNPLKKGTPPGHVILKRFLTVPVIIAEKIVGVVGVANKSEPYDEGDINILTRLVEAVWHKLDQISHAQKLFGLEWMLKQTQEGLNLVVQQPYGDLTELNLNGVILKTLGRNLLAGIARDCHDLLQTSSAVSEIDGAYAYEVKSAAWCRLIDQASRKLCGDVSNVEAMKSGKWICHNFCWEKSNEICIKKGEPVDIECFAGLRIYAVPIFSGKKVIGAINFSYGDPPRDQARLLDISRRLQIPFDVLKNAADQYLTRPEYIIDMVKKRLKTTAQIIGLMVENRQVENRLLHTSKMEAIGRLAGGIAHDFNNMLGVIQGHAEMALLETDIPEIARI
ncbi:MAG: GAF domain-containing protein, partial [Candidatus Riflebacteria bacterium]